jgi:hypothetical protein
LILELIRLEENDRFGSFGVLKINKKVFCVTLEPSDQLNAPFVSSIPAQQYNCTRIISPKYGETFRVEKVPGRDNILFHAGNFMGDTQGCILLAQHFGKLNHNRAILNSGVTFRNFINKLRGYDEVHLTIKEVY